ncbi:hypothetical protein ACKFKF_33635 [Phormidesmis sp. 146-12]
MLRREIEQCHLFPAYSKYFSYFKKRSPSHPHLSTSELGMLTSELEASPSELGTSPFLLEASPLKLETSPFLLHK